MKILLYRCLPLLLLLFGSAGTLYAAVQAPDFALQTYGGGRYHLQDSRGKEVVVVFAWASW
jgi:hypothetical protein